MEINQLILILVIVVLASVMTVIGIEVFFILKELRESVKKVNKIIDDAGIISESVAKPVASLSGFLSGFKSGAGLIKIFTKMVKDKEEKRG